MRSFRELFVQQFAPAIFTAANEREEEEEEAKGDKKESKKERERERKPDGNPTRPLRRGQ